MQRVLSFQTARGFGESSEFITKRTCFSFIFSVGFLCTLCGFLLGRFAAGRVMDIRAEKTRLQLAGNGLEKTEHLREALIRRLSENSLSTNYVENKGNESAVERIKDVLLELKFFREVTGNGSCIVASVAGVREPDRYVVLSGSNEGVAVVLDLARAFTALHRDFKWRPRRSLVFMISLGNPKACRNYLPAHMRGKVVAYIALDVQNIGESGYFVATGSDVVQSIVLQAGAGVENPNYKNNLGARPTIIEACKTDGCLSVPRLELDIPNAALTFMSLQGNASQDAEAAPKQHINAYRRALARISATIVWRLSEMMLFPWSPIILNPPLITELQSLNSSKYEKIVDRIEAASREMIDKIVKLTEKVNKIETSDSLKVRITNDLSMQFRRILLCSDENLRSRSDWQTLRTFTADSSGMEENLRELLKCYENAKELLQENNAA